MSVPFEIPPTFSAYGVPGGAFTAFLDRLPGLVRDLVGEWELTHDGHPWHGVGALAVPVRTRAGRPAVLKVSFPHDEAEHEAVALQAWRGNGAVQLLRADPHRWALLLERLHADEDLTALRDVEACEIVGGLYRRLHVPALPQLRRLSAYVERWTERLAQLPSHDPVPRRLVEQAVSLGRGLIGDDGTDARTVHGDLHYANVLAGDREPWLAIDPKPVAGDPHYEVAPMLWNRWEEVVASGNVRDAVRRRFHTLVDTAELDEGRARDWVVVRGMHHALWTVEAAVRKQRPLDVRDQAGITAAVAIAKAVQD